MKLQPLLLSWNAWAAWASRHTEREHTKNLIKEILIGKIVRVLGRELEQFEMVLTRALLYIQMVWRYFFFL